MAKQDLSSGSLNLPGFEDLGINYADSYSPTRGGGQQDYFTNIQPMGEGYGENLMDQATADLIKRNVVQSLSNPAVPYLRPEDYFPDINRGINVGQFSGPLGSIPLFAAGAGYEPLGVLDAKNTARRGQMDEYQKQMLEGIAVDYRNIKDKIRNEGWLEKQDQMWGDFYGKKLKAAGGNKLLMGIMAKDDPEKKLLQAKIDNATSAFDRYFDEATSIVLQYQGQTTGTTPTSVTRNVKNEDGSYTTVTEREPAEKGLESYVSPYMAKKAMDFLNFYTKQDLTVDNIRDFNPNEFAKAIAIEKAAAETMKLRSSQVMQNVSSYIYNALNANKLGLGDIQNTDKNQVYTIADKSGLDADTVRKLAESDYQVAYGRAMEVYGKDTDKVIPDFESEFLPYYDKLIHEQVKQTMHEVAQSGIEERAKAKKLNKELKVTVPMAEEESKTNPGTVDNIWNIPKDKQKSKVTWITTGSKGTIVGADKKTYTGEMKEGFYMPVTVRKNKTTGDITTDYVPVQQVPQKDASGNILRDINNQPVMDYQPTQNYTVNAPYSHGQSAIEAGDDVEFENFGGIKPYTQTQQWKSGTQSSNNPTPQPAATNRTYSTSKSGKKIYSEDGGKTWLYE